MNQHHESAERAISYVIGGGGVTWGGFVAFTGELTTVIGFITAIIGCGIVALRFYRDIKRMRENQQCPPSEK